LVVDSSGNLTFGAGGTGVSTFKGLSDTPSVYTTMGQRLFFLDGTENGVATNIITDSTLTFDSTNNILKSEKINVGNNASLGSSLFILAHDYTSPPPSNGIINDIQLSTGSGSSATDFTISRNLLSTSSSEVFRDLKGSVTVVGGSSTSRGLYGHQNIMSIYSSTAKTIDYVYGIDTLISISGSQQITEELIGCDISISNTDASQFSAGVPKIGSRVNISGPISSTSDQIGFYYESTDSSSLNPRHFGFKASFDQTSGTGFLYESDNAVGPNLGMIIGITNNGSNTSKGISINVSNGSTTNRSIDVVVDSAPSFYGSPLLYHNMTTNPSVTGTPVWTYVKDTKFVIAYDVDGSGSGTTVRYTTIDLTNGTVSNSTTAP
jgi:hypothetical protein